MPKSNVAILCITKLEWYVIEGGSKNGHQKDICLKKKVGIRAQHILTILRLNSQHDREGTCMSIE